MAEEAKSWPELGEELARKSLDILHDRVWQFQQGKINKDHLRMVVDTLYDATSGLIDWDVSRLIYSVRKECRLENSDPANPR